MNSQLFMELYKEKLKITWNPAMLYSCHLSFIYSLFCVCVLCDCTKIVLPTNIFTYVMLFVDRVFHLTKY